MLRRVAVAWLKFTDVSGVLRAALMMEAAGTSETSVNFYYQTIWRNIPEDSHHLVSLLCLQKTSACIVVF
jgi:hypothetical protein